MGLFDEVRSSYPLIDDVSDLHLQTKDLDCLMLNYWISPAGQLYEVRISDAYTSQAVEVGSRKHPWQLIKWVRNGKHGTVSPCTHTALVRLYPAQWQGDWENWPECKVYLRNGVIREVIYVQKGLKAD